MTLFSDEREKRRKMKDLWIKYIEQQSNGQHFDEEVNILSGLIEKNMNYSLTLQEKVKMELIQNMFAIKPRFSDEVKHAINYSVIANRQSGTKLRKIGITVPSNKTLKQSTTDHILDFKQSLVSVAEEYYTKKIGPLSNISALSVDATAVNIQGVFKNGRIYGFEEDVFVRDEEEWKQFIDKNSKGEFKLANNIATFHVNLVDDVLCKESFILKTFLKTKYNCHDIENWATDLKGQLEEIGLPPWFFVADFAQEHYSFMVTQLKKLKPNQKSSSEQIAFIRFSEDAIKEILIPLPDIRHLERNFINQFISPKRLIVAGMYPFCIQTIFDMYMKEPSPILVFPRNFFDRDKQNQSRCDFLINPSTIEEFSKNEELKGVVVLLQAVSDIVESVRSKQLNNFERLRKVFAGGWIILLQCHFALFVEDYGTDHTFSEPTIRATVILMIAFILTSYRMTKEQTKPCLFFQLQEYPIENFYSICRSMFGSTVNLNSDNFMTAINNYIDMLFGDINITPSHSTRKSTMSYEISNEPHGMNGLASHFPTKRHLEFIIFEEYDRAVQKFADLCDAQYIPPKLRSLLISLQLDFLDAIFPRNISSKKFERQQIEEFVGIEQKLLEKTTELFPERSNNNQKTTRQYKGQTITLNGTSYHVQRLTNQLTSIDKQSLDTSRRRRFDKQSIRSICNTSSQLSQEIAQNSQPLPTESNQFLKVGDYITQYDQEEMFIGKVIQIRRIVSKTERKHKKENRNWAGSDYKHRIQWEFVLDTKKGSLDSFRFILNTYKPNETTRILQNVSHDFTWNYEQLEDFILANVENNKWVGFL